MVILKLIASLTLLISTTGFDDTVDVAFPDLGVVLSPDLPLSAYNDVNMIALTLSVRKPELTIPMVPKLAYETAMEISEDGYSDVIECYRNWNQTIERLKNDIKSIEEHAKVEEDAETIIANLDVGGSRKRRSVGQVIDGVIGFLSDTDEGKKTEVVQKFIKNAIPTIKKNLRLQVQINGETVHEIGSLTTFSNKEASQERCDYNILRYYINKVGDCGKYSAEILRLCNMDGFGFPRDAVPANTPKNIAAHSAFNGTLFENHPTLLRKYGQLQLQRTHFDAEGGHLYYILAFPRLMMSTVYLGYSVLQTGFIAGKNCFKFALPSKIALINGTFYRATCESHFSGICKITSNLERFCLHTGTVDPSRCKTVPVHCEPYSSINTKGGLLLSSNDTVRGFIEASPGKRRSINVKPLKHGLFYLSWHNYSSAIMPDGYEVTPPIGPYMPHKVISMNYSYTVDAGNAMHFNDSQYKKKVSKDMEKQEDLINILSEQLHNITTSVDGHSLWGQIGFILHALEVLALLYISIRMATCVENICRRKRSGAGRVNTPMANT